MTDDLAVPTATMPGFTVELVNPANVAHRARCTRCPWQSSGIPAALVIAIDWHTAAHDLDDIRSAGRPS